MPFRTVFNPEDIATLTDVLNTHCERHGINSEEARMSIASSLLRFYQTGVTDAVSLAKMIANEDDPDTA